MKFCIKELSAYHCHVVMCITGTAFATSVTNLMTDRNSAESSVNALQIEI